MKERGNTSPSSRGRGLKCGKRVGEGTWKYVALFTRAWIEIESTVHTLPLFSVALFTRAWIEITYRSTLIHTPRVALFTRAWIEMLRLRCSSCRQAVALFTRAWIEMHISPSNIFLPFLSPSSRGRGLKSSYQSDSNIIKIGRPLHEGVD